MSYPGGAPGGYPGPGQQQPAPNYGPPPSSGVKLTLAQILSLVGAGLGLLNLFLGFAPAVDLGPSFFEGYVGWVPALLLTGGLLGLAAILPGDKKAGLFPSAVVVPVTFAFLFSVFVGDTLGAGGILILIFGLLEMIVVVVAYLFELGVLKPPQPRQQVPFHPQQGQFPPQQQPGGFNPPSGQFQSPYGQPATGQQTTFAPQQGQFGQPQQPPPATPPGGHPTQG
ncbi:antigen 34 kDa [Actinokineospora spheciospongiae]|uniref:Antigen 34 kDa n=1 Tax=Actinokineospora spheciospongiae TaxID=909613 RepID=W7J076_9PSEU|nr:DUF5336 domain-containing protein [Actinokineospora spheciospongiae]EWC62286.1 antigen 34 kDa [Actinokineospora spheciospongiae]PWW64410.1 hypothetical protein DFQ13_103384 [Actinokineospora spheciospongiae]